MHTKRMQSSRPSVSALSIIQSQPSLSIVSQFRLLEQLFSITLYKLLTTINHAAAARGGAWQARVGLEFDLPIPAEQIDQLSVFHVRLAMKKYIYFDCLSN